MSLGNGLKLASNLFVALLYAGKTIGDMKKHATHEHHHQLCDCMGYCIMCIMESATAKGKAKAKSSQ